MTIFLVIITMPTCIVQELSINDIISVEEVLKQINQDTLYATDYATFLLPSNGSVPIHPFREMIVLGLDEVERAVWNDSSLNLVNFKFTQVFISILDL